MRLRAVEVEPGKVELWVGAVAQQVFGPGKGAYFEAMQAAKAQAAHRKVPLLLEAENLDRSYLFRVYPDGSVETLEGEGDTRGVQCETQVPEEVEPSVVAEGQYTTLGEGQWSVASQAPPDLTEAPVPAASAEEAANAQVRELVHSAPRPGSGALPFWGRAALIALLAAATVFAGVSAWRAVAGSGVDTPAGPAVAVTEGQSEEFLSEIVPGFAVMLAPIEGGLELSVSGPGVGDGRGWDAVVGSEPMALTLQGDVVVGTAEVGPGIVEWEVISPTRVSLRGSWEVR